MASTRAVAAVALLCSAQLLASPLTLVKAGRLLDPRTGNVLSPAEAAGGGRQPLQRHVRPRTAPRHRRDVARRARAPRRAAGARGPRGRLHHRAHPRGVALRNAIDRGRVAGPRMLAAGRKITQRGAYVRNLNPALADANVRQEFLEVASADDGRVAVEQNFAYRSRSSARSRRMPRRCSAGRTASARSCQGDSRTSSPSPAIAQGHLRARARALRDEGRQDDPQRPHIALTTAAVAAGGTARRLRRIPAETSVTISPTGNGSISGTAAVASRVS